MTVEGYDAYGAKEGLMEMRVHSVAQGRMHREGHATEDDVNGGGIEGRKHRRQRISATSTATSSARYRIGSG